MSIKLDEINIINVNDMDYYESCYEISLYISGAINPVFEIYGNHPQMALEILVEKLVELDEIDIIAIEIEEDEEEHYYNVNGYWINLNCINIKEIY